MQLLTPSNHIVHLCLCVLDYMSNVMPGSLFTQKALLALWIKSGLKVCEQYILSFQNF